MDRCGANICHDRFTHNCGSQRNNCSRRYSICDSKELGRQPNRRTDVSNNQGNLTQVKRVSSTYSYIFRLDFDPTVRHTFFSVVIGGLFIWLGDSSTSQLSIQRFQSLPTVQAVKRAAIYFTCGIMVLYLFCTYNGLLLYATYWDCDPLTTKLAKERDQLVPLLVMKILGDYPGLTGCFVAGVFSAAMSSLSTALNSLAAVILEDFILPTSYGKTLSETGTSIIMRGTVIAFGTLAVALVFVVKHLGQVIQLNRSLP